MEENVDKNLERQTTLNISKDMKGENDRSVYLLMLQAVDNNRKPK